MRTGRQTKLRRLAGFLYEVGSLRKIARSHRQTLLTDDLSDNIASHSYRVALIGYVLAKMEKADAGKVVLMCLTHDLEESRCGDQNWLHKRYVEVADGEILEQQLGGLLGGELKEIAGEYAKRESKEARVSKDADLLDQILLLREYAWRGNREAVGWLKGGEQEKRLVLTHSKRLAREIVRQKPSDWWSGLWVEKRRKKPKHKA